MSDRFWITHPILHRQAWRKRTAGLDGTETMLLGHPAVHIVPPPPPHDVWVCDFCNEDIPVMVVYEDETLFPRAVPSFGTYALCDRCFAKEGGNEVWGYAVCDCEGCHPWVIERERRASELRTES